MTFWHILAHLCKFGTNFEPFFVLFVALFGIFFFACWFFLCLPILRYPPSPSKLVNPNLQKMIAVAHQVITAGKKIKAVANQTIIALPHQKMSKGSLFIQKPDNFNNVLGPALGKDLKQKHGKGFHYNKTPDILQAKTIVSQQILIKFKRKRRRKKTSLSFTLSHNLGEILVIEMKSFIAWMKCQRLADNSYLFIFF